MSSCESNSFYYIQVPYENINFCESMPPSISYEENILYSWPRIKKLNQLSVSGHKLKVVTKKSFHSIAHMLDKMCCILNATINKRKVSCFIIKEK